jgi:phage terminase small subunit
MKLPFTPQQQAFIDAYILHPVKTEAARRAGYSEKTAKQQGSRLTKDPDIAAAIRAGRQRLQDAHGITLETIVRELKGIAYFDPRSLHEWGPDGVTVNPSNMLTDGEARAIAEVSETVTPAGRTISVKVHNKLAAIDRLTKLLGIGAEYAPVDADDGDDIADDTDPEIDDRGEET